MNPSESALEADVNTHQQKWTEIEPPRPEVGYPSSRADGYPRPVGPEALVLDDGATPAPQDATAPSSPPGPLPDRSVPVSARRRHDPGCRRIQGSPETTKGCPAPLLLRHRPTWEPNARKPRLRGVCSWAQKGPISQGGTRIRHSGAHHLTCFHPSGPGSRWTTVHRSNLFRLSGSIPTEVPPC